MKSVPVHKILGEHEHSLFAMLDAAQISNLPALLSAAGVPFRSLFEGESARNLEEVAPYLVCLRGTPGLLQRLVEEGWGRAWAAFFSCDLPFDDVRGHLRKFLLVNTDDGRQVYFRYYDPRVLRAFLPTCSPEQLKQFFGPIHTFWMEADDPAVCIAFSQGLSGLQQKIYQVQGNEEPQPSTRGKSRR
jgi:hypothetical protein